MREFLQGFLGSAVSNQAPQYLQVQLIIINDYYDEMHDYTIIYCFAIIIFHFYMKSLIFIISYFIYARARMLSLFR